MAENGLNFGESNGKCFKSARYRALAALREPNPVIAPAIAREVVGFIWAIARAAQLHQG